ncbi:hypothetical protein HHUSO_G17402 [Huso huso]|uniref:Uncharacterized protein n=1 Tax=Huso huso TaxID=61971 RepID=A0ABR0Z8Q8_HUSHU
MAHLLFFVSFVFSWPLWLDAEVVEDFETCNQFFYKNIEPTGLDPNYVRICQKYNDKYDFATLYSTDKRIPIYSAYQFNFDPCESTARPQTWFIEPQLSGEEEENMIHPGQNKNAYKERQAISDFYVHTDFNCSQLNPSEYQCNKERMTTFTLTNAVPLDQCFNRVQWQKYKDWVKSLLMPFAGKGTAYFVTGVVPSGKLIPEKELHTENMVWDFNMVAVPSHVWTALCFDAVDPEDSFSIAYMGENLPHGTIESFTVERLVKRLNKHYNTTDLSIFDNNCSNPKDREMLLQFIFDVFIPDSLKKAVTDSFSSKAKSKWESILFKKLTQEGTLYFSDSVFIEDINIEMKYRNRQDWFQGNEQLKSAENEACVLKAKTNKEHSSDTAQYVCTLVPEKSATKSIITADGTRCLEGETCEIIDGNRQCNTENGKKLCCATPCMYSHERKSFTCSSFSEMIVCSPQYSTVTIKGKSCLPDQECATYEKSYYWCHTPDGSWDYCTPPLASGITLKGKPCRHDHVCGTYGKTYNWCYIDDKQWDYCCTTEDPHEATNGKLCRSDHKCGAHGKDYNWCYTDVNDHWEYCCTPHV